MLQALFYILLHFDNFAVGSISKDSGFRIKDEFPLASAVIHSKLNSNTTENLDDRTDSSEKYDSLQTIQTKDASQLKILQAFTDEQFRDEIIKDLDAKDSNGINIPAEVVQVKRKPNKRDGGLEMRDLDALVQRWEYRSGLDPEDVDGCGSPVCANIDSRPIRFRSWCHLAKWMMANEHIRRFLHIQKGDCADAIEGKGHDWNWGSNPGACESCQASVGCREKVCIAAKGVATTFTNICEAMKVTHAATDVVTILFALGDCENLLTEQSCLYTEWFDIDEPCYDGDTESATQNMAMVNSLPQTGRFRMCPRIRQVGEPQFRTIEGGEIPQEQKVLKDFEAQRLTCLNKDQTTKPGPPNHWFDLQVRCRDYKMRHCCQCLYGCYPKINGQWKVDMPQIGHLYEECEWMPFVSQESPRADTWDAEDRATALNSEYKRHVCGGNIFDAMYIDARTREDDIPWDETGEIITKNTPSYGFLCINKNNKPFNKKCSDYKVRYCCLKQRPAQWGEWSEWTDCSKTCGGGIRTRDRVCNSKKGNKETCFGNWVDLDETGKDRHASLKYQEHACNVLSCPGDANFLQWMSWETCPVTCGQAQRRRRRGCNPPTYGGKPCPSDRREYEEYDDCKLQPCPDPLWTTWTEWSACSATCGLGKKRKSRKCEDTITRQPMQPGLDCLGGASEADEECKLDDCPINGQWTEWQSWGSCSVLCGREGHRLRQRYCSNPLPQFGGDSCPGDSEEKGSCPDLNPCPVNCEWSEWGAWSSCSITCGNPGEGLETRGRHIHQKAEFGGRKCTGQELENQICLHESMSSFSESDKGKAIFYCPVDCVWAEWTSWSTCPDCFGEVSGYLREDLPDFEQVRTRKILQQRKYRGKKCGTSSIEVDTIKGQCTIENVPPCPVVASGSYTTQWTPWTTCLAQCGKKGQRKRDRQCSSNDCNGSLEETEPCSGFCPPEGWSQWEMWSNCPVTCGTGQRARIRYCRDDKKEERRGKETCQGVARETQRCDMGRCGSVTQVNDVVQKFAAEQEAKEQGFTSSSPRGSEWSKPLTEDNFGDGSSATDRKNYDKDDSSNLPRSEANNQLPGERNEPSDSDRAQEIIGEGEVAENYDERRDGKDNEILDSSDDPASQAQNAYGTIEDKVFQSLPNQPHSVQESENHATGTDSAYLTRTYSPELESNTQFGEEAYEYNSKATKDSNESNNRIVNGASEVRSQKFGRKQNRMVRHDHQSMYKNQHDDEMMDNSAELKWNQPHQLDN